MLGFSETAFDMAVKDAEEEIDRELFQQIIRRVVGLYFIKRQEEREQCVLSDFFEVSFEEVQIPAELRPIYRRALGVYFNRQKQRRGMGTHVQVTFPKITMPTNRVEEVSPSEVRIRASLSTSITFKAIHDRKKVKWDELVEKHRTYHFDFPLPSVSDDEHKYAKMQALAVINSKRKQRN